MTAVSKTIGTGRAFFELTPNRNQAIVSQKKKTRSAARLLSVLGGSRRLRRRAAGRG